MNKAELINSVAASADVSKKEAEAVVSSTFDAITAALKDGDKVQLVGFGSFEVKKRAARVGRNPKTKESIEIPASVVPVFKAGKALKDAVANEACDNGLVTVNGKPARASYDVKVGDQISLRFGQRIVTVEVLDVQETVRQADAGTLYREIGR